MAIVSAPSALMTRTAQQLLAAAEELGLPPSVVRTTGDTPLGLGFEVPDEIFDHWVRAQGVIPDSGVAIEPKDFSEPVATTSNEPVGELTEVTVTTVPKPRGKRGPGAKPITDGPEV